MVTGLQGFDSGGDDGEDNWWMSFLMALMVIGATLSDWSNYECRRLGLPHAEIYYMDCWWIYKKKELKETGSQTPEDWDDHATAERCLELADRWSYMHGEEVERREGLQQKVGRAKSTHRCSD